ncbi:MAG: glucose-6-phosphate isomerase [Pirellula sp.]|nr:glucose-6-phosphate isomerase [Pirellula sp.]
MKLRKNTLQPLRFDYSGALGASHGIDQKEIDGLLPQLAAIRDEMMSTELEMLAKKIPTPAAMEPLDAGFVMMPARLLKEYESDRSGSELGRLFKRANQIHALVDRVVVLGIGGSYMGARAILESCCQPYWNELSRADRGSKPRMYFEGNNVDNDSTQALLHLLGAHKNKEVMTTDERWALVVISKSGGTLETAAAFRQFLSALEVSVGGDRNKLLELLVPVTGDGGKLHKMATELGVTDMYPVPDGVGGRFSILSAVGLVPTALLGVNVIELLQGAAAMTDHFAKASAQENIVLQHVAVNHLLEKKRNASIRVMSVWSKALESFGLWYDQLSAESLGKQLLGFTPLTTVNTRDLHSRHQQHQEGARDKVFNNVIVDSYRFDHLPIGSRASDADSLNEIADKTLPEVMKAAIDGTNQALRDDGRPYTNLHVPCVDELHMGQLFQMMMLATVVEGRLMGINPYGQPGVESYKKNMNRLLGRK